MSSIRCFRARFKDLTIFEAMQRVKGGHGQLDAIALWEYQAMIAWRMSEAEYSDLSLRERARRVVAVKLSDWMSTLESDEAIKKQKNNRRP